MIASQPFSANGEGRFLSWLRYGGVWYTFGMKIYVAHPSGFDYENMLYKPLRASSLNKEHEIFLPHENGQHADTQELIRSCDLVIAEISLPSTGEGIELGRAEAMGIPILCISRKGIRVSDSLRYITEHFLEYSNSEEMLSKVTDFLKDFSVR